VPGRATIAVASCAVTDPAAEPRSTSGDLERRTPVPARAIPYEVQAYPMPSYPSDVYPPSSYSGRGYPGQLYPPQPAADAQWPLVAGEPPPQRRRPLLVIGIVVALVLVLGGGGLAAYFLVAGRTLGSATPAGAVEGFLDAVYTKHNGKEAAGFVCPSARDESELDQVVFGVKTFEKDFPSPRTSWTYPEIRPDGRQAKADVTLTLATANEQVSQKRLTLLLVDDRGWWVCDVQTPSS
jgi:hypothetical protein